MKPDQRQPLPCSEERPRPARSVEAGARRCGVVEVVTAVGPELAQLVVAGLWDLTSVVTKTAFDKVTRLAFIFARFALMTMLAFAVLVVRRQMMEHRVRRVDLGRFALAGVTDFLAGKQGAAGTLLGDALSLGAGGRRPRDRQPAAGGRLPAGDVHRLPGAGGEAAIFAVLDGGGNVFSSRP